jgi:radical SAM superfamily enzyme YgiQ (UPF0313 family)
MFILEQGPIRPPSEADSLLLRLFRGCPWNKCTFCHAYRGQRFQIRNLEEIKEEVRKIKEIEKDISFFRTNGNGRAQELLYQKYGYQASPIIFWLTQNKKKVFFQDADGLIGKTDFLLEVINLLKSNFEIDRITTYGRARSVLNKSKDELVSLFNSGLNRIHMGLESGSDSVLKFTNKGVTADDYIMAAKKVKEAGMELCIYIILGLGGEKWSEEHSLLTGKVLDIINPHYIRVHTLAIHEDMPIYHDFINERFMLTSEDSSVIELKNILMSLNNFNGEVICTHPLNLLTEINGKWPQDKIKLLDKIDEYLNLGENERLNFQLGRRMMLYNQLSDLKNDLKFKKVEEVIKQINSKSDIVNFIRELQKKCV